MQRLQGFQELFDSKISFIPYLIACKKSFELKKKDLKPILVKVRAVEG